MITRPFCRADYASTYADMQAFTSKRGADTTDELWLCEHESVFTLGLAGQAAHVLAAGDIAVVPTNRGGQVTFHGPGQVVAYPLIDLKRAGYFVKEYVYRLEEAIIRTLMHFGVTGHRVRGAPGIYVSLENPFRHGKLINLMRNSPLVTGSIGLDATDLGVSDAPIDPFQGLAKIAALGIKVSRHCTYHGLALNVAMALEPFERINPCGYAGLKTVDLASLGVNASPIEVAHVLADQLAMKLAP